VNAARTAVPSSGGGEHGEGGGKPRRSRGGSKRSSPGTSPGDGLSPGVSLGGIVSDVAAADVVAPSLAKLSAPGGNGGHVHGSTPAQLVAELGGALRDASSAAATTARLRAEAAELRARLLQLREALDEASTKQADAYAELNKAKSEAVAVRAEVLPTSTPCHEL